MSLSVIIVNYRTPELTRNCLRSLYRDSFVAASDIIVVDNNSQDDSFDIIMSEFPGVRWIQMDYNSGFARANNAGIRKAKGSIVLLLNSDTIVERNVIHSCYLDFIASDFVACGVQLLNEDGTPQISGNYFVTGSLNNLLPLRYLGVAVKGVGTIFGVRKPHVPSVSGIADVDWINGAFLMVKLDVIGEVGLMDEDFFLYSEEAEWCYRLRKRGRLAVFGGYRVVHLQGGASKSAFQSSTRGYQVLTDKKGLQIMLSNFVRIRKQNGRGWFLFHLMCYMLEVPTSFIIGFFRSVLIRRNPIHDFKQSGWFARNVFRVWRFFRVIWLNRPFFYRVL